MYGILLFYDAHWFNMAFISSFVRSGAYFLVNMTSYTLICTKVNIPPRPHSEIAGNYLSEVNDSSSNYSQLVAAGDIQVVLSYTYAKASLINIPPDEVTCLCTFKYR